MKALYGKVKQGQGLVKKGDGVATKGIDGYATAKRGAVLKRHSDEASSTATA